MNHLHHAHLICGPSSDACRAHAARMAQSAVCSGGAPTPCGTCPHCKKAAAGIHPDVITVAPEAGRDLTVAQIRALRRDAYIRPNEAACKVYCIEQAHRMNPAAQNALLKVLEEGPGYAVFLLTAPAAALLLPTVVSRCQTTRVGGDAAPAPDDASETAAALCTALLGGDPRAVLRLCVGLEGQKRDALAAILDALIPLLLRGEPRKALPLVEAARTCRAACERNVGAGHIAGYLAASVG